MSDMSQTFKVVVTDQVFPSIATETQLLAAIGARIEVADCTPEGVARIGGDADALLNTYLPITGPLLSRLPACKIVAATQIIKVLTGGQPDYPVRPSSSAALSHPRASPIRKDGSA
jgi:hypothetical protein